MCYALWLAIPLALMYVVVQSVTLTDPLEGWRIRDHPTAERLDAVILATRDAGLHDDRPMMPPLPPSMPLPPSQPGADAPSPPEQGNSSAPQSLELGSLVVVFQSRDSRSSVLTAAKLAEVARLEAAVLARISALCLRRNASSAFCAPVVSVTAHLPAADEVHACVANRSSASTVYDDGEVPVEAACLAELLAWRVAHSSAVPAAFDSALDGTSYWSVDGGAGTEVVVSAGSRAQLVLRQLAEPLLAGGDRGEAIQEALTRIAIAERNDVQADGGAALAAALFDDPATLEAVLRLLQDGDGSDESLAALLAQLQASAGDADGRDILDSNSADLATIAAVALAAAGALSPRTDLAGILQAANSGINPIDFPDISGGAAQLAQDQSALLRRLNDTQALASLLLATGAVALAIDSENGGGSSSELLVSEADLTQAVSEARAGTLRYRLRGLDQSVVDELATWSETDVRFAALLLQGVAAAGTFISDSTSDSAANEAGRLRYLITRDFNGSSALGVRSYFPLGYPITTSAAAAAEVGAQRELAYEILWPMLDELLREEAAAGGLLSVSWTVQGGKLGAFATWLGFRVMWSDMSLALLSLCFIYIFICIHSRSLLLGTLGTLEIFCSFPLALSIYRFVLGVRLFGVMHIIGIYVILGIGCDDLFVLLDAWNQVWMAPASAVRSTEARMWWAYSRAVKAMLVTTITDVSAFLSTLICVVPNLMSFAIFTALLAVANFALVCTMWPCALILHERLKRWQSKHLCCPCERPPARRIGLAAADGAAKASDAEASTDTMSAPSDSSEPVGEARADSAATPPPAMERLETISLDGPPPETRAHVASYVRRKIFSPSPSPPASPPASPPETPATPPPSTPTLDSCAASSISDDATPSPDIVSPPMPRAPADHANHPRDGGRAWLPPRLAGTSTRAVRTPSTPWRARVRALTDPFHVAKLSHLWRRSGEVRRSMPRGSRYIERMYAEWYAPFLTRGRNAMWVLGFSTLLGLVFGYYALQLRPAARAYSVWPSWHNEYQYLEARDTLFELAEEQVHVFWGVSGVDRTGVDRWNESDIGQVVWDNEFNASDPDAQVALLHACESLPMRPELQIAPGGAECVMGAFYEWEAARSVGGNVTWPITPATDFRDRFGAFLFANQNWGYRLSVVPEADGMYRLRHVVASFTIAVERHAPASTLQPIYDAWQAAIAELNAAAPPSCSGALQASAHWVLMSVQQLLMLYTVSVILALAVVGFVVLTIATRSLRLASCCMLTVLNVVGTFTGIMVSIFGMELGMIECVVLMVSVGLMLDPLTHVAHAFNEAHGSRAQRLSAALTSIGISVLAATLSTAGSCICLLFCTITLFLRFGQLLCTLLFVTVLYTNTFLAPLLCLLGPSDDEPSRFKAAFSRCMRALTPSVGAFRHRQFDETGEQPSSQRQSGADSTPAPHPAGSPQDAGIELNIR